LVTLIAIGVTGVDDAGGKDFSGELCSCVEDVLLAGEARGGGAVGVLCDGEDVVKLNGPNGGPFDSTELKGIPPGMPLWANDAPNVRW
jgi:hypothetical protein